MNRMRRARRHRTARIKSSCGKKCYATEGDAWAACIRIYQRWYDLQAAFKCHNCRYYHTGHSADARKQAMLMEVSKTW